MKISGPWLMENSWRILLAGLVLVGLVLTWVHPSWSTLISKRLQDGEDGGNAPLKENFTGKHIVNRPTVGRCPEYPLRGTLRTVLDDLQAEHVEEHPETADLWFPCRYGNQERQLQRFRPRDRQQIVYAIAGADEMTRKENIWRHLRGHWGPQRAEALMPPTYILDDPKDVELLQTDFRAGDTYILKKNIQRKRGLKLTRDLSEMVREARDPSSSFVVAQRFLYKTFPVEQRKVNLRLYVLWVCRGHERTAYLSTVGKCLYTSAATRDSLDMEEVITSLHPDDPDQQKVYETLPLTADELYRYIEGKVVLTSSQVLQERVERLLQDVSVACVRELCLRPELQENTTVQLFGADVILTDDLRPMLLELNKGPDMGGKNPLDVRMKEKVQADILELVGFVDESTARRLADVADERLERTSGRAALDRLRLPKNNSFRTIFALKKTL